MLLFLNLNNANPYRSKVAPALNTLSYVAQVCLLMQTLLLVVITSIAVPKTIEPTGLSLSDYLCKNHTDNTTWRDSSYIIHETVNPKRAHTRKRNDITKPGESSKYMKHHEKKQHVESVRDCVWKELPWPSIKMHTPGTQSQSPAPKNVLGLMG